MPRSKPAHVAHYPSARPNVGRSLRGSASANRYTSFDRTRRSKFRWARVFKGIVRKARNVFARAKQYGRGLPKRFYGKKR